MASIDIFLNTGDYISIGGNELQGGQQTLSIRTGKDTITYYGSILQIENLISEIGGE